MRKHINITIDEELVKLCLIIAKRENRSLSNVIENLVREALASK